MFLKSILSPDECQELVDFYFSQPIGNHLDPGTRFPEIEKVYDRAEGYFLPPMSLNYINRIEKELLKKFEKIEFQNTYMRVYDTNGILKMHTDREDLDITVSICLEHDFDGEYPLNVSNKEWKGDKPFSYAVNDTTEFLQDYNSYELKLGDGVAMEGVKYPHWRNRLYSANRAIYIFYHWKIVGSD